MWHVIYDQIKHVVFYTNNVKIKRSFPGILEYINSSPPMLKNLHPAPVEFTSESVDPHQMLARHPYRNK